MAGRSRLKMVAANMMPAAKLSMPA